MSFPSPATGPRLARWLWSRGTCRSSSGLSNCYRPALAFSLLSLRCLPSLWLGQQFLAFLCRSCEHLNLSGLPQGSQHAAAQGTGWVPRQRAWCTFPVRVHPEHLRGQVLCRGHSEWLRA